MICTPFVFRRLIVINVVGATRAESLLSFFIMREVGHPVWAFLDGRTDGRPAVVVRSHINQVKVILLLRRHRHEQDESASRAHRHSYKEEK